MRLLEYGDYVEGGRGPRGAVIDRIMFGCGTGGFKSNPVRTCYLVVAEKLHGHEVICFLSCDVYSKGIDQSRRSNCCVS